MRVGLLCSNAVQIDEQTKKGTEIFVRILTAHLHEQKDIKATAFASEDSSLPVPVESFGIESSAQDPSMPQEKRVLFELASISEAVSRQDDFDLFHVNIGDGDIILPFAKFIKKPVLITLHHAYDLPYVRKYFSLFRDLPNVFFVSISNAQRHLFPDLRYVRTIYHGVEEKAFAFSETGGNGLLWAGRGIPAKGLDAAFTVAGATGKTLTACIIRKPDHSSWLQKTLNDADDLIAGHSITTLFDVPRDGLIEKYRQSKAFLFPLQWEEPFGLVVIEALATGTPVIAFARGAAPEIIADGKTGFLVNYSDADIRGDFTVKKTGNDGLIEAVERLYSLSDTAYRMMRRSARKHVENHFTASRMTSEYATVYRTFKKKK